MIMIGEKLRTLREYRNLTQDYMADQLGITQSSYSKYETNQSKMTVDILKKIAQILEVSPVDLVSNQPAIINFESTIHGQGIAHIDNFFSFQREFLEKMIASKDAQIAEQQKTIATLQAVIESLTKK